MKYLEIYYGLQTVYRIQDPQNLNPSLIEAITTIKQD